MIAQSDGMVSDTVAVMQISIEKLSVDGALRYLSICLAYRWNNPSKQFFEDL